LVRAGPRKPRDERGWFPPHEPCAPRTEHGAPRAPAEALTGARARRAGSGQELEPGDPMSSQAPPERRSRRDIDGGQTTTAARSPSWTPSQTTARQPSRRAQRSVCSTRTSNAPSRRGTKCPCLQSTGTFAFVRGFMSSARAPRAWILYLGLSVLVL